MSLHLIGRIECGYFYFFLLHCKALTKQKNNNIFCLIAKIWAQIKCCCFTKLSWKIHHKLDLLASSLFTLQLQFCSCLHFCFVSFSLCHLRISLQSEWLRRLTLFLIYPLLCVIFYRNLLSFLIFIIFFYLHLLLLLSLKDLELFILITRAWTKFDILNACILIYFRWTWAVVRGFKISKFILIGYRGNNINDLQYLDWRMNVIEDHSIVFYIFLLKKRLFRQRFNMFYIE
jgi:hypothetical protein